MGSIESTLIPKGYVTPDEKFLKKLDELLFEFFGRQGMGCKVMPYSYEVTVDNDGTAHINLEIYRAKYFENSKT